MVRITGVLGLSASLVFSTSLLLFGLINREFSFWNDYISKLGARGESMALWWNIFGFVTVGLLLAGFGFCYGVILKDRMTGSFLSAFGFGFALTAIPIDMENAEAPFSKVHVVVICLALASWLFGLARMGYNRSLNRKISLRANIAAIVLTISILGFAAGLWTMPVTHRLVFGVVFFWTALTSAGLILKQNR